jgi:hypothetical protein
MIESEIDERMKQAEQDAALEREAEHATLEATAKPTRRLTAGGAW